MYAAGLENRVLRKIRETKREKVTGDWRKLHIEELLGFYHQTIVGWYNDGRLNARDMWHLRRLIGIRGIDRKT